MNHGPDRSAGRPREGLLLGVDVKDPRRPLGLTSPAYQRLASQRLDLLKPPPPEGLASRRLSIPKPQPLEAPAFQSPTSRRLSLPKARSLKASAL